MSELVTVAALYVQKNGAYFGLPGVDPWDEERDARLYDGPYPVVAHPPCSRWCRLAGLVEARWGHKRGDDGGCFEAALASVRKWGGVLEHPAYTSAFAAYGIPAPHPGGGWQRTLCGGWVCHVEQGRYGHVAKKATWLYAHGSDELPSLQWGSTPDNEGGSAFTWCGNKSTEDRLEEETGERRQRIGAKVASHTPEAFKSILLSIARGSRRHAALMDLGASTTDLTAIAYIAGHKNVTTTTKYVSGREQGAADAMAARQTARPAEAGKGECEMSEKTVRVRVLVAIDEHGSWAALGAEGVPDDIILGDVFTDCLDIPSYRWVEADVPVPVTVRGELAEAGGDEG